VPITEGFYSITFSYRLALQISIVMAGRRSSPGPQQAEDVPAVAPAAVVSEG
jgi:hypothetical protein